jgi:hypothetical protein
LLGPNRTHFQEIEIVTLLPKERRSKKMKILGLFLAGLLIGVPSFAFLQAKGAGGKAPAPAAAAVRDVTCFGGSVAAGIYSNLNIAGPCNVDSGSITVEHNLTVLPGGLLNAQFGGNDVVAASDVTVAGNLEVRTNGVLILGCEPFIFTCANDPDPAAPTFLTTDAVGGNLTAEDALAVVVHASAIGHNVTLSGGGGGVTCSGFIPQLLAPPYGDFEDNTIGGNLTISGLQTCFLGAFRDTIRGNINWNNNVNADPDGNEMATNSIGHNFNCSGNTPNPQIGDSGGSLNLVSGRANGQCVVITLGH